MDACNAFNSLNRITMLLHAHVLWPRCSSFLSNTYRGWSVLVLRDSFYFLYSKEGVTQGDPLSMFMYAVGTLPLIHSLHNPAQWTQVCFADDASVSECLNDIHEWFSQLCSKVLLLVITLRLLRVTVPLKCNVALARNFSSSKMTTR